MLFLLCVFTTAAVSGQASAKPATPPANFKSVITRVNGVRIHYVVGGKGEPLVLLHGFGQNWYMWNRLLPEFSKHFTVIAPDLPGVGESDIRVGGYDKRSMAALIYGLVKQLGYTKIRLAGHDVGLMVAYAYAAEHPEGVTKLALMDALIPGIEPVWGQSKSSLWWFGFFARPIAGDLVKGKVGEFLTDFWPQVGHVKDPFTPAETAEFIRAYSVPGATTGSFHWFGAFPQDAKDNLEFAKHKLPMPVLALAGEFSAAPYFTAHIRMVANDVSEAKILGAGHWVVQEGTPQVQKALLDFFR